MPDRQSARHLAIAALLGALSCLGSVGFSQEQIQLVPGEELLARYFKEQCDRLAAECLDEIETREDWENKRKKYRLQLREMLGLMPWPERTPLNPVVTGKVDHPEISVEKLHFQSRPGLYVTANFYLPKERTGPLPTILYVCGHGRVKKNGVSLGNKTHYQHHAAWFARHGYACLIMDTIQLGEIEGVHHGTYRHKMWWWNSRGYTPAGVEAWNGIRALDYLQSRPEVDGDRIGITGRSGGGAYSWWVAALDERIKVAVPVAGITSLHNHVVDGCVEGHCDCMYQVNTYRWDYPKVAALLAPRPLLISNSDKDTIFPLDGVVDVHRKVRRIYELCGASDKLGLQITEGPHKDTQELRVHAFHWFNRFLKGENPSPLIRIPAEPLFEQESLKVFDTLPPDEKTSGAHEFFVPVAEITSAPADRAVWERLSDRWRNQLRDKVFGGWPREKIGPEPRLVDESGNVSRYVFRSQSPYDALPLHIAAAPGANPKEITLKLVDEEEFAAFQNDAGDATGNGIIAVAALRGIGPTAWREEERYRTHVRRRFNLVGQTLDGMRVWDAAQAVRALRKSVDGKGVARYRDSKIVLEGSGVMAGTALYAGLMLDGPMELHLTDLPATHRHEQAPVLLNVLRYIDMPQTMAMVLGRHPVSLRYSDRPRPVSKPEDWKYAFDRGKMGGAKRLRME